MAKANSVEAEIDEIIIDWETDCRNGKYHRKDKSKGMMRFLDWSSAVTDLRRQILSVVKKKTLELPHKSGKLGIAVILTHDFWQALKNSRRDDDEDKKYSIPAS